MRLSCPTCDAVYEVPSGAIPEAGRDVQCSNCGTVWFQRSGEAPAPPSAAALDPAANPKRRTAEDMPRPPLSDEGRRILVEEAERERSLRAGARPPTHPDPDTAAAVDSLLAGNLAPARAATTTPTSPAGSAPVPPPPPATVSAPLPASGAAPETGVEAVESPAPSRPSRRDRLPDIADVSPTLGRAGDGGAGDATGDMDGQRRGSGFRLGFALALILAAIGLVLYMQADRIGAAVPALDAPLHAFRDWVNEGRIALDGLARNAAAALEN